jgi:hypothetical protein
MSASSYKESNNFLASIKSTPGFPSVSLSKSSFTIFSKSSPSVFGRRKLPIFINVVMYTSRVICPPACFLKSEFIN